MKKLFVLFLVAAAVTGCCGRNNKNADAAIDSDPIHNARTSLDIIGTYTGVVPVTNAPGREITLTLLTDSTYAFDSRVLERGPELNIVQASTFEWDETGNNITLNNLPEGVNRFRVEENRLRMVDSNFELVGEDKADKFILNKVIVEEEIETPVVEEVVVVE